MHPPFYLIEALLFVINSHGILEKDIGFVPRIFQVSIGSIWTFTTNSKSSCFSIEPPGFVIIGSKGCGSLIWALGVPVWLQSNTFAVPWRTWTCHCLDLTESPAALPRCPSRLEPSWRLRTVMLVTHFCGPQWGCPCLAERKEKVRQREQRASNQDLW